MTKTIVVTGASGFIGRKLVQSLAAADFSVYAIVGEQKLERANNVVQLHHDLSTGELPSGLPENADAVVHLAQSKRFRDFPRGARDVFAINVAATMALLDWSVSASVRNFVLASSGGVYSASVRPLTENDVITPTGPLGFYAASKQCAEILAGNYVDQYNVAVLRFFFVYGPGQSRGMLIPRLMDNILSGRPILLNGTDGMRMNPTYIDDAVRSLIASLGLGESQTINVAGPETWTLRSIAKTLGEFLGAEPVFSVSPSALTADLVADTSRMAELLGPPTTAPREGLRLACLNRSQS